MRQWVSHAVGSLLVVKPPEENKTPTYSRPTLYGITIGAGVGPGVGSGVGSFDGILDGKEDGRLDGRDEGSSDGEEDGLLDGTMEASSVGAIDGGTDGISVGRTLMDGVLDGPGDGYGDPVGTVGPGLGCPVSVGEVDGTKDTLGWLDGDFETLGVELGAPSNPLSLAPSPSLSNTLDPSPLPVLPLVESDALPSEQTVDRSTQKDPTVPTERHVRPRTQSLLVLHVAKHWLSKQ